MKRPPLVVSSIALSPKCHFQLSRIIYLRRRGFKWILSPPLEKFLYLVNCWYSAAGADYSLLRVRRVVAVLPSASTWGALHLRWEAVQTSLFVGDVPHSWRTSDYDLRVQRQGSTFAKNLYHAPILHHSCGRHSETIAGSQQNPWPDWRTNQKTLTHKNTQMGTINMLV